MAFADDSGPRFPRREREARAQHRQIVSIRWPDQLLDALDACRERVGLRRGPAVRDLVGAALRAEGEWPPGRTQAARVGRAQGGAQPLEP